MISTNEFKTGVAIELDGNIFQVMEFQHVKPGKGGAFVRTKLKNLRTGAIIDYTFNAGIKISKANIEKNEMSYIYASGDQYVFMNNETYEQIELNKNQIEYELNYLTEGLVVNIINYNGEIIGMELPDKVTLEIVEAAPGVRGNTVSNATKEAFCNTGLRIAVPLFVEVGDKVIVSTSTGKYDTRAK